MDSHSGSNDSSPASFSPASTTPSTPPEFVDTHENERKASRQSASAYARWRPSYHVLPPTGWMNDPCAPGFDPATGQYVLSFQWNPKGPDWGDICWGTATSPDMTNWTVLSDPTLQPDKAYDCEGVFTGCLIPSEDGALTMAYTSVNQLPIHHTLPHVRGSESLSLARSTNGGSAWTKLGANPILPGEPGDLDVTGWRDPYVSPWPAMACTLKMPDATLFGIISGGIRDITPTSFLYALHSNDITRWEYIGPLTDVGLNMRSSRWSGDLGRNWEVTNFVSLRDDSDPSVERQFLVMGTEGCLPSEGQTVSSTTAPFRPARGQLWMSGSLQSANNRFQGRRSPVQMEHNFGGYLDHGCLYAANSFHDPVSDRQVLWGWITEDDLSDKLRHQQGWSGMLSLPRELRLQTLRHVIRASASKLEDITNLEKEEDGLGTFTVRTLRSQPLQSVQRNLRQRVGVRQSHRHVSTLDPRNAPVAFTQADIRTSQWELQCSFRLSPACRKIGLSIGHSADFRTATVLSFQPKTETFKIERPSLSLLRSQHLINSTPEIAPHTLFTLRDPVSGHEDTETLDISAWRDNSVLEVFVNGRTAISTRLYAAGETFGIRFFADDDNVGEGDSELVFATLWDGIGCA